MQYNNETMLQYARRTCEGLSVLGASVGTYKLLFTNPTNPIEADTAPLYILGSIVTLTAAHLISRYQENKAKTTNVNLEARNDHLTRRNDLLEEVINEDIAQRHGIIRKPKSIEKNTTIQ